MTTQTMEQNKALIRRLFEQMDRRKGTPEELYAPTFTVSMNGSPPMDMAALKQMSGGFFSAFPDLKHVLEDLVSEGDKVAVRGIIRGTHKADFMGIKATNKQIAVSFMSTIRLAGGKNVEQRVVLDQMGLMQQLGAIPAPGQGR